MSETCPNCTQSFNPEAGNWFELIAYNPCTMSDLQFKGVYYICSPSCLTEFAWKLRESEPKLSKSTQGELPFENDGER